MLLTIEDIKDAATRLEGNIHKTPIVSSKKLNQWLDNGLGHQFYFKAENLQKIGAFKARGAYNSLSYLKQHNKLPKRVVAYSSGNHAQAVAWAAEQFGIKATVYSTKDVSAIKAQATRDYGAELILCDTRKEAEEGAKKLGAQPDCYLLPPYDHDQVICGQGTCVLEALEQQPDIDTIFIPCSGGGLLAGAVIAAKAINPNIKVYGVEPQNADDACRSLQQGKIVSYENSPQTIADGARALALSERTFTYAKMTDGMLTANEDDIIYWTQWLTHLLKMNVEPTSALCMAGAAKWLSDQTKPVKILVVISGGNIAHKNRQIIWQHDLLTQPPMIS